jgi:hypothetical protein
MFYTGMVAISKYPQTPKTGLVVVFYFLGSRQGPAGPGKPSFDLIWKLTKVAKALPIRLAAVHLCYDSILFLPAHAFFKVVVGVYNRIRLRSHYGESCDGFL